MVQTYSLWFRRIQTTDIRSLGLATPDAWSSQYVNGADHHQLSANMAATLVSFRWLDILEKEFDEAFVDLDILIGTQLCA